MSGLARDATARLASEIASFNRAPGLPPRETLPTSVMLQCLGAADRAAAKPAIQMLEILRTELHAQAGLGEEPNDSELRNAPWILWSGEPKAVLLPKLLERIVDHAARSRSTLRYLIEAWIRDYDPGGPRIGDGGSAIRRLLHADANPRLQFWRNADKAVALFDAHRGPSSLAQAILHATQPVATILEEAGFSDPLRAVSGYLKAVQDEVLRQVPAAIRSVGADVRAHRTMTFLTYENALRFDDQRISVARGMCGAWRDAGREPPGQVQESVKNFLVSKIGNPQIKPGRWVGAQDEAALVRRWLARASLKLFFELIDDHARNATDTSVDRQWRYREAFWTACLERGFIDDAWLVLGRTVYSSARAREALGDAFGRLDGGSQSHAALLFRIGPLTISEWSNNGPMRAWKGNDGPKMWQKVYVRSEFEQRSLPFPDPRYPRPVQPDTTGLAHRGSATGMWQSRAALLLAQHASIVLNPSDWRLK